MVGTTARVTPVRPDSGNGAAAPGRPEAVKLPRPPQRRRPGLAALAVLLIVGGAAAAGVLAMQLDSRVPVLVAATDIAAGRQITEDMLTKVDVAADGLDSVRADGVAQVVGSYARQSIPRGRLLDHAMLSTTGLITDRTAAVGLVLKPAQVPASGLIAGDVVSIVRVRDGETFTVLADRAVVSYVASAEQGGLGGGDAQDVRATVVVPREAASKVAAASASGQVAVVLTEVGSTVLPPAATPQAPASGAASPTPSAPASPAAPAAEVPAAEVPPQGLSAPPVQPAPAQPAPSRAARPTAKASPA